MRLTTKIREFVNWLCLPLGVSLPYFKVYGKLPRLSNPRLFNEKIQWLKLHVYGKDPLYTECSDKLRVRDFLIRHGHEELLIPLISVYDNPSDIDFDKLPERFVLKWNFGNGFNIVCNDKQDLDLVKTRRMLHRWGKVRSELISGEMQYRDIPRKIICEENIAVGDKFPTDYKFHCFDGKCILGFTINDRETGRSTLYGFDRELNPIKYEFESEIFHQTTTPPPGISNARLKELMSIAETLSKPFHYVRVDLFQVGEIIYFSEFTFSEGGGYDHKTPSTDLALGSAIDLKVYQ